MPSQKPLSRRFRPMDRPRSQLPRSLSQDWDLVFRRALKRPKALAVHEQFARVFLEAWPTGGDGVFCNTVSGRDARPAGRIGVLEHGTTAAVLRRAGEVVRFAVASHGTRAAQQVVQPFTQRGRGSVASIMATPP